ncbi:hypothetical protein FNV65_20565 [Streptomyces sp. S1A1-8]|uniref:DUF6879 family protein n=1 Tax=unclassified Streptomyces TaxID=2593676 RepID=UPI001162B908|nr:MULTISPECIES: DUF6879 family protein [unclassified Streptomyces]QDO20059.1 hypothetical protein FNV65_20565 [Streptomyces sp. S1A1-8]QDO30184.1 hypothetical protein FNV63_20580 [Streptomyces sp. S1A1-3]
MTISPTDFGKLFAEFQREAFRLETLSVYTIPDEQETFSAFKAGEPQPDKHKTAPWVSTIRKNVESGKRMYRVHVVRRPLTDYLRYEMAWGYVRNAAAGEEFFILDVTDRPNPLEGIPDFWAFDESAIVTMEYNGKGEFLGAQQESEDEAGKWLSIRDSALAEAVPFADWWAEYGGK